MKNLKKIILLFTLCFVVQIINAQNEFISIWQSTNSYPTIEIPTYAGEVYNYNVNWGDGSISNNIVGDITHNYAAIGNYTVTITGVFPGINFSKIYPLGLDSYNKNGILSIEQWGNNQWKSMNGAFKGQESLVINANDTPDLSLCTDMTEMFRLCKNINNGTSITWNNWNTITITNMSFLFANTTNFNQPIGNWNTSNVINMEEMFIFCDFNQPIPNWDVSKVTSMYRMFRNSEFNQSIGNWNVSSVINMEEMFNINLVFNQPIDAWNVSNVQTMESMFAGARDFNQPLNSWDVSEVLTMEQMFDSSNFNENITGWNVSKVTNMGGMFFSNDDFNQPIGNWNVSNVEDMSSMFNGSVFNQDISNWNVSSLQNMTFMFANDSFNQDIGNWNTSNVTNMSGTFLGSDAFDQDISSWNVEKVTTCFRMFENSKMSTANYDALLIAWNAQNLQQNVSFNAGGSKYFSNAAKVARQNMINNDNWIITDDGKQQIFTWTGAISTDWNTAGNWDTNSMPTATDDVVLADVANAPRVNFNQSHTVNNLTVNKPLTIKTNASLTVNGNLDQGANIQVESFVNGNGSFILRGNQTNLNPADLIYLRYISGNNWHLFSSPVTQVDIDAFAAATALAEGQNNNRGIGFHNNNANPNWNYYQNGAVNSGDFIDGKGYSIQTSANAFLNFTGKLKSNNLSNYPITENLNGWNLVGNPYPANINANVNADTNENFLTVNADNLDPLFANIYLWNPSTTSYEPIGNGLGAKYIAPAQAFFIKSKTGGGTININKSMLTHQIGNLFLKENLPQKIVLKIDSNNNTSETTIAFKSGMTKGLDITYDAAVFNGESRSLSLYSYLIEDNENIPFAIQFLPDLDNNDIVIPLGIKQNEVSEITLSLKETNLTSDKKIYIEDTIENVFTEISKNKNYTFLLQQTADKAARFFLHFQKKSLSLINDQLSKVKIYKSNKSTITVLGLQKGQLNIYNISGKIVLKNFNINQEKETISTSNFSKGIYFIKIKNDNHLIIKKIII